MKRTLSLLFLACVVLGQKKTKAGYLTDCKGPDDQNGQVIVDTKVAIGQEITFSPFIVEKDEIIHGKIMGVADAPKEAAKPAISSEDGKTP